MRHKPLVAVNLPIMKKLHLCKRDVHLLQMINQIICCFKINKNCKDYDIKEQQVNDESRVVNYMFMYRAVPVALSLVNISYSHYSIEYNSQLQEKHCFDHFGLLTVSSINVLSYISRSRMGICYPLKTPNVLCRLSN